MSRALLPRGSATPSRRSTRSLIESSKGPNRRFLSKPSAMILNKQFVRFYGLLNQQRKTQACPDRRLLASVLCAQPCPKALLQSHAGRRYRDAWRCLLGNRDRTLSRLSAPPEWGRTVARKGGP